MVLLRARVDLGAMTMKRYSTFPKTPTLLEPHNQFNVIYRTLVGVDVVISLCRNVVGVFYSPSQFIDRVNILIIVDSAILMVLHQSFLEV